MDNSLQKYAPNTKLDLKRIIALPEPQPMTNVFGGVISVSYPAALSVDGVIAEAGDEGGDFVFVQKR